jgi:hypothetical protein
MNLRNLCIVPESLSNRYSTNMTGRSGVISCHSRDIGIECLLFCNHYKDDGWGHVQYHDLEGYLSVLIKVDKVIAVVKRLKVLATCREIWKAVSLVTNWHEEWTYLPPLVIWFFTHTDVWEYVPRSG